MDIYLVLILFLVLVLVAGRESFLAFRRGSYLYGFVMVGAILLATYALLTTTNPELKGVLGLIAETVGGTK